MEKEFTGTYPIFIDERETGIVSVAKEGLFWCFEAQSETVPDMVRLSVFGEGGEGYLGVMEPKDGLLWLRKKLSKSAVSGFPCPITHGGRKGMGQQAPRFPKMSAETVSAPIVPEPLPEEKPITGTMGSETSEAPPEAVHAAKFVSPTGAAPECGSEPEPEPEPPACAEEPAPETPKPPQEPECPHSPPLVWHPCGCPASYLNSVDAKQILGSRTGVLEASDDSFTYLAMPEDPELTPDQLRLFPGEALILGKSHLVCRVRNGNLV